MEQHIAPDPEPIRVFRAATQVPAATNNGNLLEQARGGRGGGDFTP